MDTNAFSLASGNDERYRGAATRDRFRVVVSGSLPALALSPPYCSYSEADSATDASDECKSCLLLLANRLAMVVVAKPTIGTNRNVHWLDLKEYG
jgi:hypothetical protein